MHLRGLWQAVLARLQPAHPRAHPHGRPAVRLPLRRLQQEVRAVDESQITHSDARETKVSTSTRCRINIYLVPAALTIGSVIRGTILNDVLVVESADRDDDQ